MDKCLQEIFDIIVTDTGILSFLELVAVYHIFILISCLKCTNGLKITSSDSEQILTSDLLHSNEHPACAYYTTTSTLPPYDWGQLFRGTPSGLTTPKRPGESLMFFGT